MGVVSYFSRSQLQPVVIDYHMRLLAAMNGCCSLVGACVVALCTRDTHTHAQLRWIVPDKTPYTTCSLVSHLAWMQNASPSCNGSPASHGADVEIASMRTRRYHNVSTVGSHTATTTVRRAVHPTVFVAPGMEE